MNPDQLRILKLLKPLFLGLKLAKAIVPSQIILFIISSIDQLCLKFHLFKIKKILLDFRWCLEAIHKQQKILGNFYNVLPECLNFIRYFRTLK